MGKRIVRTKGRSGDKHTYKLGNGQINVLPYFLYEVSIDKLWKNGFCCLKSRYFKSDKYLKVKDTEVKYYDEYSIVRTITLIGAPYSFVKERNLSIYKSKNSKK